MGYKVCIVCDEVIESKEQVDYDILASLFKYDSGGSICGETDKPMKVFFHLKCFKKYKNDEKKTEFYFTQVVGAKRIIMMDQKTNKQYSGKLLKSNYEN